MNRIFAGQTPHAGEGTRHRSLGGLGELVPRQNHWPHLSHLNISVDWLVQEGLGVTIRILFVCVY